MAPTIPLGEPRGFTAFDTVKWRRQLSTYPPSEGWTLKYTLTADNVLTITCTDDGTEYTATISSADSGSLITAANRPRTYKWRGFVVGSGSFAGEQYEVGRGTFLIQPDTAQATEGEQTSHAETMLEAIEAELERRAGVSRADGTSSGGFVEVYTIGGRSIQKVPLKELVRLRSVYAGIVARQRSGGEYSRPVEVSFPGVA